MSTRCATSAVLLLAILSWPAHLAAQRFSYSATAATPVTASCSLPGYPTQVQTAPAGTSAGSIGLLALLNGPNGFGSAFVDGQVEATPAAVALIVREDVGAYNAGSASAGPHEFLLAVQSAVPSRVLVEVEWTAQVTPGLVPLIQVDIGDDQVIDFLGLFPGQRMVVPVTLGPSPFGIRTRTQIVSPGGALQQVLSTLRVTVRADLFGSIQPVRNLWPCGEVLAVYPDLEQNLVFERQDPAGQQPLAFLVIGFRAIGWLLPGGCILWPDPQVTAPLGTAGVRIDMLQPQARGLSFSAQSVSFGGLGPSVRASAAYAIQIQ